MTTPGPERRQTRLRHKAYEDLGKGQRQVTARQAVRGSYQGATAPVRAGTFLGRRYSARGMLTAELLAGVAIVAIRAVEDYEPQADGTLKGKIGHPEGQYGPLPILAGLLVWFFLLSFLAARGGTKGKVAVVAGGLTDLVLAMKSTTHFEKVAATFQSFGKATVPAGTWVTSGTQSGNPIAGSSSPSESTVTGTGTSSPASAVTQDQESLAASTSTTPNPGVPFVEAQAKNVAAVAKSAWDWIDDHLFGGKSFFNGL